VSIQHVHPVALCTDLKVGEHNPFIFKFPENLAGFGFNLFFLVGDVRNDVVDESGANTGYPAPRRLHCDDDLLNPESRIERASLHQRHRRQLGFVMMYPHW
jgi:hypothetical protein